MTISSHKFQNIVIATIVGWLVLLVFMPNLMIIGTSFLTRDDANFVSLTYTLDNYARLLDPSCCTLSTWRWLPRLPA